MVKSKTGANKYCRRSDMDHHCPYCSLDPGDMLRGVPTVRYPIYPWHESEGVTNVHHA